MQLQHMRLLEEHLISNPQLCGNLSSELPVHIKALVYLHIKILRESRESQVVSRACVCGGRGVLSTEVTVYHHTHHMGMFS